MSRRCLRFQVITLSGLSVHEKPPFMQGREYSRAESNTNRSAHSRKPCKYVLPPIRSTPAGRAGGPMIDRDTVSGTGVSKCGTQDVQSYSKSAACVRCGACSQVTRLPLDLEAVVVLRTKV